MMIVKYIKVEYNNNRGKRTIPQKELIEIAGKLLKIEDRYKGIAILSRHNLDWLHSKTEGFKVGNVVLNQFVSFGKE